MKNVFDIRYEKNLTYILSSSKESLSDTMDGEIYEKTAIILYLYYMDTLSVYWLYLDGIQNAIDVYIISSKEEILEKVREHVSLSGRTYIQYILKENRGRDVSAFLVTSVDIVKKYEYVCFLHDKKEHCAEMKKDTELWIKNLWGNLINSAGYIDNILHLFIENPKMGILAPPEPIGDHFREWYGYGWGESFGITKELVDRLKLNADIAIEKPPITLGTTLWFRSEALQKLLEFGWKYTDFDDERLKEQNYLSYGIERLFPYVAQDAGFETATVMTIEYAREQTGYLQYSVSALFSEARNFFPIATIRDLEDYKINRERVVRFAEQNIDKKLYLYGAGVFGRFCLYLLEERDILPYAYLVSGKHEDEIINGLPVYSIYKIKDWSDSAVVITVLKENIQKEMIKNLEAKRVDNYIVFWNQSFDEMRIFRSKLMIDREWLWN